MNKALEDARRGWQNLPVGARICIGVGGLCVGAFVLTKSLIFIYLNRKFPIFVRRIGCLSQAFSVKEMQRRIEEYVETEMRETDIVVAVPEKSGTTWTQHILHQIRMHAEPPSFKEQFDISPWLELGEVVPGYEMLPQQPEQPEPRIFKSHLNYKELDEWGVMGNCKTVFVFRDLKDAVYSAWRFITTMMSIPFDDIPLSTFLRMYLGCAHDRLCSLVTFWQHRHDHNIAFFLFEEMRQDHEGVVRKLAEFAEIELQDEEIEAVVEQTTHKAMANEENWFRFSETGMAKKFAQIGGYEFRPDVLTGKVRKTGGTSGQGKQELPAWASNKLDQLWKQVVTAKLGFETYDDMREAWRQENS